MEAEEYREAFPIILQHARETALWSTSWVEENGTEHDNLEDFDSDDFSPEAEEELRSLIQQFLDLAGDLLNEYPGTPAEIGHDLILTVNRHGAGFWDRGYGDLGDKLTSICHSLGGYELWVGEDGRLYV